MKQATALHRIRRMLLRSLPIVALMLGVGEILMSQTRGGIGVNAEFVYFGIDPQPTAGADPSTSSFDKATEDRSLG